MRRVLMGLILMSVPLSGCATLFEQQPSILEVNLKEVKSEPTLLLCKLETGEVRRYNQPRINLLLSQRSPYALSITSATTEPVLIGIPLQASPWFFLNLAPMLVGTAVLLSAPAQREIGAGVFLGGAALSLGALVFDGCTGKALNHAFHQVEFELRPYRPLTSTEIDALDRAASRYGDYLRLEARFALP